MFQTVGVKGQKRIQLHIIILYYKERETIVINLKSKPAHSNTIIIYNNYIVEHKHINELQKC